MTTPDLNKEKFLILANNLAISFPEYSLHIVENHWRGLVYFEAKNDPSKGFYLSPDHNKGKFTVSAKIEKKPHYSFDIYVNNEKLNSPEVGFSIDRPVEQIVKGIKTRFLPDFETHFKLWTEKWQSFQDYETAKRDTIREFAEILGADPQDYVRGNMKESLNSYHSTNKGLKEFISDVRVSSPDSIEIKTNYLTKEKAKLLLEFIKTL